jgi:hypothetical protein
MFTEASDPLEFGLLHCPEFQKTLYAAQQLHGPTSAWWASYYVTLQDGHQVSWAEFCQAFHGDHISSGHVHLQDGSQAPRVPSPTAGFRECLRVQQAV